MKIYTSTYRGKETTYQIQDLGNYKLRVVSTNSWSDLISSVDANDVEWHISKKKYRRLVKLYNKLYRLYDNIQHELWIKNNSSMRFKNAYKKKNNGYKYLETDNVKLIDKLSAAVRRLKNI